MDWWLVQEGRQEQRWQNELQGSARLTQDDERGHERAPRSSSLHCENGWAKCTNCGHSFDLSIRVSVLFPFSCLSSQMADRSHSGTLEDDEFVLFYKMLTQREDALRVFQEYSADGQKLSQNDLEDFLREEQLEGDDIHQHAKQLIEHYEPSDTGTWTMKNILCLCVCLILSDCRKIIIMKAYLVSFVSVLTLSYFSSQAAQCHDIWRLPDVPWLSWGLHLQPTAAGHLSGHEPASVPLLHLLLPQHLPDGGPVQRTEQCGGIHQVTLLSLVWSRGSHPKKNHMVFFFSES